MLVTSKHVFLSSTIAAMTHSLISLLNFGSYHVQAFYLANCNWSTLQNGNKLVHSCCNNQMLLRKKWCAVTQLKAGYMRDASKMMKFWAKATNWKAKGTNSLTNQTNEIAKTCISFKFCLSAIRHDSYDTAHNTAFCHNNKTHQWNMPAAYHCVDISEYHIVQWDSQP